MTKNARRNIDRTLVAFKHGLIDEATVARSLTGEYRCARKSADQEFIAELIRANCLSHVQHIGGTLVTRVPA